MDMALSPRVCNLRVSGAGGRLEVAGFRITPIRDGGLGTNSSPPFIRRGRNPAEAGLRGGFLPFELSATA